MPCSTIRAWVIGVFFSCCVAFINGFFEIRQPPIAVGANVPQLLAYPVGKLMEKVLPDVGLTLFGVRHSLNPGPFNRKEHMLITIMSNVAKKTPYTNYIFWIQYLPQYFNQSWAISFGYQILVTISTNFIGYGLAGLCRRFLVYPAYCLWPTSLVTIALNTAFHGQGNPEAAGPFGKIWRWSRLKVFMVSFLGMFSYFWLPSSLFMALSSFSWMTWISPNNVDLNIITGSETGLGVNLLPTFDWNRMTNWVDPLMIPFFTTGNLFMGAFMSAFIILAMYYSNAFGMAHLPINANVPFDNMGLPYNVSAVIDERGIRDEARYQAYSMAYSTAGHLMLNMAFFASYPAALLYAVLYHRRVLMMGFRDLFNSMWSSKKRREHKAPIVDVHIRLMSQYNEVPEWWYLICLSVAAVMGLVAVACWPTNTTPAVVFFGVALALVFVVPIGIVMAMTGIELPLHVLSQFLGGSWVDGNALALCFFKSYGYLTCSHALHFSSDLKVAHYLKIPPRMTFCSQMVPTLVSTLVCVGILQYQIHLDNICTREAAFRFYCPTVNTFFTQAVLWGTVGPKKLWGAGGPYSLTLLAFPIGAAITVLFWTLGRRYPRSRFLHNTHPVILIMGGVLWAPFNLTYIWPAVPVAAASWLWIKVRYVALWSKVSSSLSLFVLRCEYHVCCICRGIDIRYSTTLSSPPHSPLVSPSQP